MRQYHSLKKNVLILISLLKELIIRRAIASPGSSAGSLQEPYFEMKSRNEGRSAAYVAWCHATETNKSIIHCASGATVSCNYIPAPTEAYCRDLPVLTDTSIYKRPRC